MRKLAPNFLGHPDFPKWECKAIEARTELLAAVARGERPQFKERVWQEFKRKFLAPDGEGKCMYCEADHSCGFPAHLEHYRPKGEVTECRKGIQHGGYFWLAYDWQNFLLACHACNTRHPNPNCPGGTHSGKLNEFRIDGTRINEPCADCASWWNEIKAERPLLLHPFFDDPEVHFRAQAHGVLEAITDRGRETIDVCDLNRPLLAEARERAEARISQRLVQALALFQQGQAVGEARFGVKEPFSMYLNSRFNTLLREMSGKKD